MRRCRLITGPLHAVGRHDGDDPFDLVSTVTAAPINPIAASVRLMRELSCLRSSAAAMSSPSIIASTTRC